MHITDRRRPGEYHKVYLFLPSITLCLSVCVTAQDSAMTIARDMKVDIEIAVYYAQIKFISNVECHAHRLHKTIIRLFNRFVSDVYKIQLFY